MPFVPHIASECLFYLEGEKFFSKNKWPNIDKSLLKEESITIVIQVNGKKRGLLSTKIDIPEKDAIAQAEEIENIKKNLFKKKIVKKIFVKNKVINFITS